MANNFNQLKYQNQYIKDNYERIYLTVKKGKKDIIKNKAEEAGESLNEYINKAIEQRINNNRAEADSPAERI